MAGRHAARTYADRLAQHQGPLSGDRGDRPGRRGYHDPAHGQVGNHRPARPARQRRPSAAACSGHDVVRRVCRSAGGERLAVGSADGYPAIWSQAPNGSWSLVTSPGDLPAQSVPVTLTTGTHGPAGWLAVGVPGPVVLASANGTTWRPAPGNIVADLGKITAVSAAAGPRGYVI